MSAHKFTPGPWQAPHEPNGRGMGWRAGPAWLGSHSTSDETKANAYLIAAAPDLLEALKGVQMMANCGQLDQFVGEPWLRTVSAAIAKAKGKP